MKTNFLVFVLFFILFSAQAQYKIVTKTDTINAFDIVRDGNVYKYYTTKDELDAYVEPRKISRNDFDYIMDCNFVVYKSNEELNYFYEKVSGNDSIYKPLNTIGLNIGRIMLLQEFCFFYERFLTKNNAVKVELSKQIFAHKYDYPYNSNKGEVSFSFQHYFKSSNRFSPFLSAGLGVGRYLIYERSDYFFEYKKIGIPLFLAAGIACWITSNSKIDLSVGYKRTQYFNAHKNYNYNFVPIHLSLAYNF
ncbi:MAG: hypothetical protein V4667_11510 [Bacteroidota bacterium]